MKHFARITILILALAVLFCICSCKSKKTAEETVAEEPVSEPEVEQVEQAAATTPQASVQKSTTPVCTDGKTRHDFELIDSRPSTTTEEGYETADLEI